MNFDRTRSRAEARNRVISAGYEIVSNRGFDNLNRQKLALVAKVSEEDIAQIFPSDAVSYTHLTLPTIYSV